MTQPSDQKPWSLRGLLHCGFCEQPMHPRQQPGGLRTYGCDPPCARSDADADGLELMAYHTAVAAIPSLAATTPGEALFAEMYRRVVVHGDLSDVRFIGYAT
jgi:hypothetical protein